MGWIDFDCVSAPSSYWSTTNIAEAMPGVLTPLGWSLWGPAAEWSIRAAFSASGALPRRAVLVPDRAEDRVFNTFYGRVAARIDFISRMGDLLPGTSGEAVARQLLGFVPPDFVSDPSRRRWPVIFARFPATFARIPSTIRRVRRETDDWWRREIDRHGTATAADARAQLGYAVERFIRNLATHTTAVLCAVQPVYDQLSRLAARAGVDVGPLMSGQGSHEEAQVVEDLWAVSRDRLALEDYVRRHGYHGPMEGEVSAVVWRENPLPLLQLLDGYRAMGEDADPARVALERKATRQRAERELLRTLPRPARGPARLLLGLAPRYLPLRGVGKVAFLQSIDVARAAARRLGSLVADDGLIPEPEDVFFFTAEELLAGVPPDAHDLVDERRARYGRYRDVRLPPHWRGVPTPLDEPAAASERPRLVTGVGASPGVVEGRVRVISDPAETEFEPGEILVAHTTDPSWASIMFLSSALVVDIGGLLSHAAVVARELGIPCVMNTQVGTRTLSTGDLCRVDGATGTVEVLSPSNP
ncbi:MAG: PEP-utilizing enzyme [Actinomycetota bacterium]